MHTNFSCNESILHRNIYVKVMLSELSLSKRKREAPHLELGTRRGLEKSMRALMLTIDELNKSVSAYNKYTQEKQKYDIIYNSLMQKRVRNSRLRMSQLFNCRNFSKLKMKLDRLKANLRYPLMTLRSHSSSLCFSQKME